MKDGWRNNCWTLLVLWEECVAAESGSSVGFPRCLVNDTTPDKAAEEQECVIGRLRPLSVAFTWLSTLASSVIAKTTASDQLSLERNQKNLWVVPLLLLLLMNSPPTVTHRHTRVFLSFLYKSGWCIDRYCGRLQTSNRDALWSEIMISGRWEGKAEIWIFLMMQRLLVSFSLSVCLCVCLCLWKMKDKQTRLELCNADYLERSKSLGGTRCI